MIKNLNINSKNISKLVKAGSIALAIGISSIIATGCTKTESNITVEDLVVDRDNTTNSSQTVTTEDINDLNLILCSDQCNPDIFLSITDKLDALDVNYITASLDSEEIKNSLSTIITLDGTSYNSDSSVVIGPNDNLRGNSDDSIALAMYTGLKNSGSKIDGINMGVKQSREITKRVASTTEQVIDKSSSFTVVAIGNEVTDTEQIANGFVDGLIRSASIVKEPSKPDILYKTTYSDINQDGVARNIGTTASALEISNPDIDFSLLRDDLTIINPAASKFNQFSEEYTYKVETSTKSKN